MRGLWSIAASVLAVVLLSACHTRGEESVGQLMADLRDAYKRMDYSTADLLANEVQEADGSGAYGVGAHLWQMRIAQRQSDDAMFYTHLMAATKASDTWTAPLTQLQRLCKSELHVVVSTYLYYMRDDQNSRDEILKAQPYILPEDTLARLSYKYNLSAGGDGLDDFDNLVACYIEARQSNNHYFTANALQSLALVMSDTARVDSLRLLRPGPVAMLQSMGTPDSIASTALGIFMLTGDVYQTACVMRTQGELAFSRAEYENALIHFLHALDTASDPSLPQVPLLVAELYEWISKTYAAMGLRDKSENYRSAYLDLLDVTRQDHEYVGRIATMEHETRKAWIQMAAVCVLTVVLVVLIWLYARHRRKSDEAETAILNDALLAADLKRQMNDERDELADAIRLVRMRLVEGKRQAVEHRAKVAYIMAVKALIDRLVDALRRGSVGYAFELLQGITHRNNRLTEWIQMRRGRLSLHIKRFDVAALLDIVAGTASSLSQQGITLNVMRPSQPLMAQADRTLTLFMINTLVDNARRYTPKGGSITIDAKRDDEGVMLSVSDTGCGMEQDMVNDLMERKFAPQTVGQHHGFGLLNCRGIIENYRKMGRRFSVCCFGVSSRVGEGSRFFFRLPLACVLMFFVSLKPVNAVSLEEVADSAGVMYGSGRYDEALRWAEYGIKMLNGSGNDDLNLLYGGVDIDYDMLLRLRNEAAVAALAMHDMEAYARHNGNYVSLFKKWNSDPTLVDYCTRLEQTYTLQHVLKWVMMLISALAVTLLAAMLVYSRMRYNRVLADLREQVDALRRQSEYEEGNLHVQNEVLDNSLSTIKHETMYFPARLMQMLGAMVDAGVGDVEVKQRVSAEILPLAVSYRDIYAALAAQAADALHHKGYKRQQVTFLGRQMMGDPDLVEYFDELIPDKAKLPQIDFSDDNATIPHLIAKQIVRDHDDMNGHPGLNIQDTFAAGKA